MYEFRGKLQKPTRQGRSKKPSRIKLSPHTMKSAPRLGVRDAVQLWVY